MKRIPNKDQRGRRITRTVRRLVRGGTILSEIVARFSSKSPLGARSYDLGRFDQVPRQYAPPREGDLVASIRNGHVYRYDGHNWSDITP